ncbi:MAG TPA: T9SS type A sorting domain-containing protein [Flavobacteriales bacterium]|nr:T9SS type A sorting domain-containing protein [Flavobacteriales bacterium]
MRPTTLLLACVLSSSAGATIWTVGPGQTFTAPSQVADQAQDGDTVNIMAGTYASDVTNWTADDLLLRGVGGFAHLESNGLSWGDKAIWVVQGDRTTIEWIEFSGCTSTANNGAGIRQEGHDLTVRHCWFHDNENGILAGTVNPSTITIEFCEFGYNGYGDGFSHNLYINHVDTLYFRFNYSHHAHVGQELKSRAHVNYIEYSRLSNEATGDASREIDLPDGGQAFVIGNVVHQGPQGQNGNLLGFGVESLTNPGPQRLYVINNTFVNERATGNYLDMHNTVLLKAWNNICAGPGDFVAGGVLPFGADTASNLITTNIASVQFADPFTYDYHIPVGSPAQSGGMPAGLAHNGHPLVAWYEYVHPTDSILRCQHALLDVGAFEHCTFTGIAMEEAPSILLYPDPATDVLNISFLQRQVPERIQVVDMKGRVVREVPTTGKTIMTLDVSGLAPAMYVVRSVASGLPFTGKFTRQR